MSMMGEGAFDALKDDLVKEFEKRWRFYMDEARADLNSQAGSTRDSNYAAAFQEAIEIVKSKVYIDGH